jgi:hypothetical protein
VQFSSPPPKQGVPKELKRVALLAPSREPVDPAYQPVPFQFREVILDLADRHADLASKGRPFCKLAFYVYTGLFREGGPRPMAGMHMAQPERGDRGPLPSADP